MQYGRMVINTVTVYSVHTTAFYVLNMKRIFCKQISLKKLCSLLGSLMILPPFVYCVHCVLYHCYYNIVKQKSDLVCYIGQSKPSQIASLF